MKVYVDVTEGDEWYIGPSARQVVAWLKNDEGIDLEVTDLREMTDEEMQEYKYIDDDEVETTFAQRRAAMLADESMTYPNFFASRGP